VVNDKRKFYLVAEEILPEAMLKTVQAKEMLTKGEAATVGDAVSHFELSRSAFYKYRDLVFLQEDTHARKMVTLSMILEHRSGILSSVLSAVAQAGGNIITITQGIPLSHAAHVTITMDLGLQGNVETICELLTQAHGVRKVEIVGYS